MINVKHNIGRKNICYSKLFWEFFGIGIRLVWLIINVYLKGMVDVFINRIPLSLARGLMNSLN